MFRKYLLYSLLPLSISFASASNVDCRVITGTLSQCNPYSSKFIVAKEISYQKDKKKFIAVRTLPVPNKTSVNPASVMDMIEKYVNIDEPMRYKGSDKKELEVLNIKTVSDSNKHSLSEETKLRREKSLAKIQKMEDASYSKFIKIEDLEEIVAKQQKAYEKAQIEKEKLYENGLAKLNQMQTKSYTSLPKINIVLNKSNSQGMYSIEKGDTLSTIARKFSMKTSKLIKINRLKKRSALHIGKKLTILMPQDMVDIISKAEYIIKSGDNIGSISKEFNLSSSDIMKYNGLNKKSKLRIGKKLTLPFPHKISKLQRDRTVLKGIGKRKLRVTATAYSSHRGQTDSTPFLAAWNNRLRPGMKTIAVSRDMLTKYGLKNGSRVRIGGLSGYYTVRDKMNKRYKKRIDIYMGVNRRKALRWGKKSVMLYY